MAKLQELMEDEATRAELESELSEWAKAQGFKAPDEVEGLVKKKDELLGKISKLNRGQTTEEQRRILEVITELGVESAEDIEAALSGKGKGDELERKLKRLQKEAEENKTLYEREKQQRISYAKDNAIIQALKEAGVKDSAFDMAFAYFDRLAQVEDNDGQVSILAKDKDGMGPPLSSYIAEWSKTEAAKDYVHKPVNQGAGVTGPGDVSTKTSFTREELTDPKIAKQVMDRKKKGEAITIEG